MEKIDKSKQKYDYEILFKDSPEYFSVENAKMIQENLMIRFICFDSENKMTKELWYPIHNIYRIARRY